MWGGTLRIATLNVLICGMKQVVQFRRVAESQRLDASTSDAIDVARGGSGEKWIYVGSKRTHTHDVKALTIATPILSRVTFGGTIIYFYQLFWWLV